MPFYTASQFDFFWSNFVEPHTKTSQPLYQEYLDRENFFEDYMDIFRGKDTRAERGLPGHHPFESYLFENNPSLPKPSISYILIGEAAPASPSQTFFYNPSHLDQTRWLSAPIQAFNLEKNYPISSQNKVEVLYKLALKGYLLLDLFPFAIDYSVKRKGKSLREQINITLFWQHLAGIIHYIHTHALIKKDCLLAFSGPALTHHRIAEQLHNQLFNEFFAILPHPYGCILNWGENGLTDLSTGTHIPPTSISANLLTWQVSGGLLFLDERFPVNPKKFSAPIFRCEVWDSSFSGPNALFMKVAFGLQ